MLYEVLAGRPPFKGQTQMETMVQVMNDQPELPSVHRNRPYANHDDRVLEMVAMKCLSKDPNERYGSAFALAADLERWQRGEPVSISAPSVYSLLKVWLNQNFGRGVWLLIVGGSVGVISGLSLWVATMQQNIGSMLQVYDNLPNAARPFTLFRFDTPHWLVTPMLALFASSIILLGFFTALFVRPKNRSADLAAGTIAGLIAAITSFLISFGTIGVISATSDADVNHLIELAQNDIPEILPEPIQESYPELKQYSKAEQLDLLRRKIEADQSVRVPWGILTGFIGSLALFFFAGILETFTAGPIVRKHKTFLKSVLPYLEMAFPIAALTIVFGIFFTAWLTLGDSGAITSLPLYAMFAFVVLAVTAKGLSWNVALRHTVLAVCFALFVLFFVRDFPFVPKVSRNRLQLNKSEKLVEQNPGNLEYGLQLGKNEINFGDTLLSVGKGIESIEYFDRAIERFELLGKEEGADLGQLQPQMIRARLRKAAALEEQGQVFQAIQILQSLAEQAPYREDVKQHYFQLCCSSENAEVGRAFIESLKSANLNEFHRHRSTIASYSRSYAVSNELDDEKLSQLYTELIRKHLENSKQEFAGALHELEQLSQRQSWRIIGPMTDRVKIAAFSLQLIMQPDSTKTLSQHAFIDLASPKGLPIDLKNLLGSGQFRSAFMIGGIESEIEQTLKLKIGCSNGVTVWVNSRKVIEERGSTPYRSGKFAATINLRAGLNSVVIKTNQRDKGWLLNCELEKIPTDTVGETEVDGATPEIEWRPIKKATEAK